MVRADYFMGEAKVTRSPRLIRQPLVSVILPTYCRGENGLLKRAVESVLCQSLSSFELIVMDDGSTDCTADLILEYVKSDDRVVHVRHEHNCGLPALRVNEGLLLARGEFCAYQFDDDQWPKASLASLIGELTRGSDYDIAYGRCEAVVDGVPVSLGGPFNYSQLVAGNYIANNSVVHRRRVFEQMGGYDMHLVMRRLCDWDLWLRWGRRAAFLFVDELVSIVEGGRSESVGKTIDCDPFICRAHMAVERNAGLRPEALRSYVIDDLSHLRHLGSRKVDVVWRNQIAPYQSRFRHVWPEVRQPRKRPIHVMSVKAHFDTTIDIMIGNYERILGDKFAFTFVPQLQVDEEAIRAADIILLYRVIDYHAAGLATLARKHGKPVVFLMDDDLTTIHELTPEFAYLAPGAPCRLALESLIQDADLVITYSRLMRQSVEPLNPRNVVLETNIQEVWLEEAKAKLKLKSPSPGSEGAPTRIAFAGGSARRDEFEVLWPAIVEASRTLRDSAEFHFWGLTPDRIEELHSPYFSQPFTFSYEQYMSRLTSGRFDVMISPLFAEKQAKRAKTPIKFLEITAAGALGIYSDVEPYDAVVDGVSGIKCENTVEAWTQAILKAATMHPGERLHMVAEAMDAVQGFYASERQAPSLAATLEAAALHSRLPRSASGRPRIAYFCHSPFLGGAENHLLRHALLAQEFRFEPVLVLPTSCRTIEDEMQRRAEAACISVTYLPLTVATELDPERGLDESSIEAIRRWLSQNRIALAHSVTLMREVGEATRRLRLPHVVSLYATSSSTPAGLNHCDVVHSDSLIYANQWGDVLQAPARRILSHVPEAYFAVGKSPRLCPSAHKGSIPTVAVFGTLQPRKGQLQAIEAIGLLRQQTGLAVRLRLFGYDHFFPDYLAACRTMAAKYGVSDSVYFEGFVQDPHQELREIDIMLCASDWESLPQVILEAMAAGLLVVAPTVGGVPEVVSEWTGILMSDNSASSIANALSRALRLTPSQWNDRIALAQNVVRRECSGHAVAAELFSLYSQAVGRQTQAEPTPRDQTPGHNFLLRQDSPPGLPAEALAVTLEALRSRLHQTRDEL